MSLPRGDHTIVDLLRETDLLRFQDELFNRLQITKIEHFDHVKESDLRAVGLSQPAIRRLLKAAKERKTLSKKSGFLDKLNKKLENSPLGINEIWSVDSSTCLISKEDIKLMENLGDGSFGVVKRALWSQGTGRKVDVAAKILRQDNGLADDFISEINAMHKLKHPNLIRLFGIVITQPFMMIVELCAGGALLDRLRHSTEKPVLLISQLIHFARQIIDGMSYLEGKSFIHRDLAARNILLADNEDKVVKIGDFGLMRALQDKSDHYVMSNQKKVPFAWCPPEALKQRKFSHASDVWSFGVTLWEMFTYGEEPWCGYSGAEILQKTSNGEILEKPDACPVDVFHLMKQCWSLQPSQRPTFAALKELTKSINLQTGIAKEQQSSEGLLDIQSGDVLIIIDGRSDSYYWLGQNMRTRSIGKFARKSITFETSKICSKDISQPMKNSFVHTGHGDGRGGESWGQPDKIDTIYLRNPLIDFDSPNLLTTHRLPKPPAGRRSSKTSSSGEGSGGDVSTLQPNQKRYSPLTWQQFEENVPTSSRYYCPPDEVYEKLAQPVVKRQNVNLANELPIYDEVPQDPIDTQSINNTPNNSDPFETPAQTKSIATSYQRYSEIFTVNQNDTLSNRLSSSVKNIPTEQNMQISSMINFPPGHSNTIHSSRPESLKPAAQKLFSTPVNINSVVPSLNRSESNSHRVSDFPVLPTTSVVNSEFSNRLNNMLQLKTNAEDLCQSWNPNFPIHNATMQPIPTKILPQTIGASFMQPKQSVDKNLLQLFDPLEKPVPENLIDKVCKEVPFVSKDRCQQMLIRHNLDAEKAIREMKVEKLVDMGIGDKEKCCKALYDSGWNIENAASKLIG